MTTDAAHASLAETPPYGHHSTTGSVLLTYAQGTAGLPVHLLHPASAPAARGAVASRLPRERASHLAEARCMSPPSQHPWRAQRRTASRATPTTASTLRTMV